MDARPPHPATQEQDYPRRWTALLVLLAGGFMNIVDISVVNVALPPLQTAFRSTSSEIEWVAAAYILAFALGLLPLGRLGDRIGRKRMFLTGIAAFTAFSALCGIATSIDMLIVSRVLQGLAAAMIMPQILASVQAIFPQRERMLAYSYLGLSAGLASITGPLLGGLLIGGDLFGLGWRWIFLINIPVGIVVVWAGRSIIPEIAGHPNVRNDWGGMAIAALAVFCLSYPLVEGHSLGWPNWAFAMMACAIPLAIIFAFYERFRSRNGRSQLMPLGLLADPNFRISLVILLTLFAGSMGGFLPITLFLQQGFDFTPLRAGLTTAPFAVGVLLGSQIMRFTNQRWPRGHVVVGAIAYCSGMLILRQIVLGTADAIDPVVFGAPLLLSGIGMNFAIASVMRMAMVNVPHRDAGSASGTLQTFQNLGSAFGIAIAGQIFFSTLATQSGAGVGRHPAFIAALEAAFYFNICAFVLVGALAFFLRPPPAPGRGADPAAQPAAAEI